jgi:hypothetical protein
MCDEPGWSVGTVTRLRDGRLGHPVSVLDKGKRFSSPFVKAIGKLNLPPIQSVPDLPSTWAKPPGSEAGHSSAYEAEIKTRGDIDEEDKRSVSAVSVYNISVHFREHPTANSVPIKRYMDLQNVKLLKLQVNSEGF